MKRWILMAMVIIAAVAAAMAWRYLPIPSSQPSVVSAADLGLLLLDTDDGISVLGVRDKSIAEQAGICPGDGLMGINGNALTTVEGLDDFLMNDSDDTLVFELQRGKDVFCVKISLTSIVH